MATRLLISARGAERRVALLDNGALSEVHVERSVNERLVGNIYCGRIVRVLPGMQSAFVEVGLGRTAFLYAGDVVDPASDPKIKTADDGLEKTIIPINQLLKEGQRVMVQVTKEPMGTKGARVTTNITLPGRHLVYMPTVKHMGVSRRIQDPAERERLRTIAEAICPEEGGLIVRTVGEGFEADDLRDDVIFLEQLWAQVEKKASEAKPPKLLHADLDLPLKATRDLLRPDFDAVMVDSREVYERLAVFLEEFMPRCRPLLMLDENSPPLFTRYGVERELSRCMDPKVWLKSGGYIVIDSTEALTAIDVNSGRYVGKSSFEDTVFKINMEAVKEIACQLRLRNIGGIIVIDFIDMAALEAREAVHDALVDILKDDKVRSRVLPMSALGLIEMTRKRVSESLTQMMAADCTHCDGRGWTLSRGEVARQVVSRVRDTVGSREGLLGVTIRANPAIVETLLDEYHDDFEAVESRTGVRITVHTQESFHLEQYEVKSQ